MQILKINLTFSTTHHSEGNAITERIFRTLHDIIAKFKVQRDAEWDELLGAATWAHNTTIHETTGETPFYLMHGRDPMTALDWKLQPREKARSYKTSVDELRQKLVKDLAKAHNLAAELSKIRAKEYIKYVAKATKQSDIKEGDLVLYRDYSKRVGMSTKYKNQWWGYVHRVKKLHEDKLHADITPRDKPNEEPRQVHLNQIKKFYCEDSEQENAGSSENEDGRTTSSQAGTEPPPPVRQPRYNLRNRVNAVGTRTTKRRKIGKN